MPQPSKSKSKVAAPPEGEGKRQVFVTEYEYCNGCDRRIHNSLFNGFSTCPDCRGEYDEIQGGEL